MIKKGDGYIKIIKLRKTCDAYLSQWEGKLEKGDDLYEECIYS